MLLYAEAGLPAEAVAGQGAETNVAAEMVLAEEVMHKKEKNRHGSDVEPKGARQAVEGKTEPPQENVLHRSRR